MRSQARSLPLLRPNAEATRLDQEVDPGHAAAFLRGVECAHAAGHGSEHSKGVHVSASTAGTSERWEKNILSRSRSTCLLQSPSHTKGSGDVMLVLQLQTLLDRIAPRQSPAESCRVSSFPVSIARCVSKGRAGSLDRYMVVRSYRPAFCVSFRQGQAPAAIRVMVVRQPERHLAEDIRLKAKCGQAEAQSL